MLKLFSLKKNYLKNNGEFSMISNISTLPYAFLSKSYSVYSLNYLLLTIGLGGFLSLSMTNSWKIILLPVIFNNLNIL